MTIYSCVVRNDGPSYHNKQVAEFQYWPAKVGWSVVSISEEVGKKWGMERGSNKAETGDLRKTQVFENKTLAKYGVILWIRASPSFVIPLD